MTRAPDVVVQHLQEAHGMEHQSVMLLQACERVVGDPRVTVICQEHRRETGEHLDLTERLLALRGAGPVLAADVREGATAHGLGLVTALHKGASARIVAAVYAYEHYEIATYEMLRRIGERVFDGELVAACDRILAEERLAAKALEGSLEIVAAGMSPPG